MPSFIAHLLLAKEVFDSLDQPQLKDFKNYFLIGSLGPDLPYYQNVFGTAIQTFFEEKFNSDSPGFYSGTGDFFHSRTPNLFPMKMIEVIRKDKDQDTQEKKLSFTLGYLTHVAADQYIHPLVEKYSGPFYVSADFRRKHRMVEVYQDIFLFNKKNPNNNNLFKENFPSWIDIAPEVVIGPEIEVTTGLDRERKILENKVYTFEWFRSFIQRAFFEAYSIFLNEKDIEKWIKGFNSIFEILSKIGPFRDAMENIKKNSDEAKFYKAIFNDKETSYVNKYFDPAKRLAIKYITLAKMLYDSDEISTQKRSEFLSNILDADLTSPLIDVQKILN